MSKPIPSPHKRSFTITGERLHNGRKIAYQTWCWVEKNKDAFFAIHDYLEELAAQGCKGRVRDRVAVWCVEHGIKVGDEEFTFSNSFWAGISRYMVLYDDSLLGHPIEFRDSDIDCYGLLPVSYLPNPRKDDN